MDDREAIEHYDRAGARSRGAFPSVRWPDLALEPANIVRLVEGVLEARCDCARLAFGDEFDPAAVAERLGEAWRVDELQLRYAPEGVFVRAQLTVRVEVAPGEDDDESAEETLQFAIELCVSFTHRHHTRPFVDFMSGEVHRSSDDTVQRIAPFAQEISPAEAIAWGLNGS